VNNLKNLGDHLQQGGPSMATIFGLEGPSMAAKIAVDGPGDHLKQGPTAT